MAKNKNDSTESDEPMLLVLEDSIGTEVYYEIVATIEYDGVEYIVLYPEFEDEAEEYTILEVKRDMNGNVVEYGGICENNLLNAVFDKFCEEYGAETEEEN